MKQRLYRMTPQQKQLVVDRLAEIFGTRSEVLFAYLYGSFAEGLPFHDLDVGIYAAGITEDHATRYALDLTQMLKKASPVPVDVRLLNFAPLPFLYHAIQGTLVFERNPAVREQIVERTIQRYLDLQPMIRRGIKEAFAP
jgi:predicted nucleotidyltransferase